MWRKIWDNQPRVYQSVPRPRLPYQIAKFMGPTWGPPGSCRPQMGPMLAPWTLLSGMASTVLACINCMIAYATTAFFGGVMKLIDGFDVDSNHNEWYFAWNFRFDSPCTFAILWNISVLILQKNSEHLHARCSDERWNLNLTLWGFISRPRQTLSASDIQEMVVSGVWCCLLTIRRQNFT